MRLEIERRPPWEKASYASYYPGPPGERSIHVEASQSSDLVVLLAHEVAHARLRSTERDWGVVSVEIVLDEIAAWELAAQRFQGSDSDKARLLSRAKRALHTYIKKLTKEETHELLERLRQE